MNFMHSFYCAGAVGIVLVGALVLHEHVGWRTLALASVAVPLFLAAALTLAPMPPLVEPGQLRTPVARLLREKLFLAALAAIFLAGATEIAMASWLPAYAEKSLGFARFTAGMGLAGFSLAMAVGRAGVSLLGRAAAPIGIMLCGCAASVLLYLGASLGTSNLAFACCVLLGLGVSCLWPSTLALAGDSFPRGGASMFAMLSAMGNLGGIITPWAVGAVADRWSLRLSMGLAGIIPLTMAGLVLWLARLRRQTAPA